MATENDELGALIVPIIADLEPLFSSIETGLKVLKEKLRSSGALKLTADVDVMLKSLNSVQPKVDQWAKDTSAKAQVTPTVNTVPLTSGLQRAQAEITHTIGSNIGLTGWTGQIAMMAQRLEDSLAPAISSVGAALKNLNFAGFFAQLRSGMTAINEFVNGLGLITKGFLVVGAAYAGWKFGTMIREFQQASYGHWWGWITGANQYYGAAANALLALRRLSDAEVEAATARIKAKYSIDMTNDAFRVFNTLAPQQRNELLNNAQAAGQLTMTVDDLSRAIREMNDAARQNTIKEMLEGEAKTFKQYVEYFSKARMSQIATDLMDVRLALQGVQAESDALKKDDPKQATVAKKRNELLAQENNLLKQKAQEYVRIQQAENKPVRGGGGAIHATDTGEAERVAKANEDAARRAADAWAGAQSEMVVAAMDAMARELDAIDKKEAKYKEVLYAATADAEAIKTGLIQIEEDKQRAISEIRERYRQEEAQKARQAFEKQKQEQESAFQQQRSALQQYVQNLMNPLQAWVDSVYDTLNKRAAVFAEGFQSMMQPLSNAFAGLITGMKVSWGNVLRQMIAQFAQIFVNKFLAWVGEMIMRWVFGETAKTTASATGAAARTAIATAEVGANQIMTVAALDLAIAEIFAAHASIPFAGVGIATAFVAQMMATYTAFAAMAQGMAAASLTGFAEGGRIDKPTWGVIGELWQPEIVAPEADFKAVIAELINGTPRRQEAAGGTLNFHTHYHGAAIIDTGNKALLRSSVRKINRENKAISKKTMGS